MAKAATVRRHSKVFASGAKQHPRNFKKYQSCRAYMSAWPEMVLAAITEAA
jgi:hypothetical protein